MFRSKPPTFRLDCYQIRLALLVLLTSLPGSPSFGAPPTSVDLPPGPGGPTQARVPAAPAGSVVVCDQMAMLTNGTYNQGSGNAIGGAPIYGVIFDLQVADDCVHGASLEITQVCQASVTFLGDPPGDGLWVQVYADMGGSPAATATFQQVTTDLTVTPFIDTVFALEGQVICADLAPGLVVPAGTWWWSLQPVSTGPAGDWYYQVRQASVPPSGGDSHGKDGGSEHGSAFGGPYAPSYGTFDWSSMPGLEQPPGDSALLIRGQPKLVEADLMLTKSDGLSAAAPGEALSYTIVVSNLGPDDASDTSVSDVFPPALSAVSWTCSASAGSACPAAGLGNIAATADLLAGGSVTFVATATIDPGFVGELINTATVTPGPTVNDPNPADNTGSDTTSVEPLSPPAIPTLDEYGLWLLMAALAGAALSLLRRR